MRAAIPLRQLAGRLGALSIDGALDSSVAALAYDARRVVPGSLFFAMAGAGGDGAQSIPRAIERGAAAIVSEQGGFVPYRATRIRVANCRQALAVAAATFYGHPSRKLQMIVVSGCAARAAVAQVLRALLSASGVATALLGSLGCQVGERTLPALAAAPEPLDIQELLAEASRAGDRACVIELAPEAIAGGCLAASELDTLIVTEITAGADDVAGVRGRTERGGLEGGFTFRAHGRAARNDRAWRVTDVLRGRAGLGADAALRLDGGPGHAFTVRAKLRRLTPRATRADVETPGGPLSLNLALVGRPNARAALAAVAVAQAMKLPLPVIAAGLARLPAVAGHLEPVATDVPVHVFVDACRSASDLEAALRATRELTSGRVLLLFGCSRHHPTTARPVFGGVAARWADETVFTADNPGPESAEVISAQVASGYVPIKGTPPFMVHDRQEAIRELLRLARPGDCVLLAGKGHRCIQELGDCVIPFDDREYAQAAMASLGWRGREQEVVG